MFYDAFKTFPTPSSFDPTMLKLGRMDQNERALENFLDTFYSKIKISIGMFYYWTSSRGVI